MSKHETAKLPKCDRCRSTEKVQLLDIRLACHPGRRLPTCRWRNKTKMHFHRHYTFRCPDCRKAFLAKIDRVKAWAGEVRS